MNKLLVSVFLSIVAVNAFSEELDQSDDIKHALIDRVLAVYGGESLRDITSFRVSTVSQTPAFGQGHTPDLDEITHNKRVVLVDVKQQRAAIDNLNIGRGGLGQGATFLTGTEAYNVNMNDMSFTEAGAADLYQLVGGVMRTTDVLLVHELDKARDAAKVLGDGMYMGRAHTLIQMPFPSSPELILYIDNETSLVSKMRRENEAFGHLDYVFEQPTTEQGFTYATQTGFFIGGRVTISSVSHKVEFNVPLNDSDFEKPAAAIEAGEVIDTSQMITTKISDRVYHVGQNGGFSIFVDTPQGVISAGGYPGIRERFDAFRTASGSSKLLTHQIVTHHHSDHVGGLGEAAEMGAKLVTVSANIEALKEFVTPAPEDWMLLTVGPKTSFFENRQRVEVYEDRKSVV